MSSKLGAGLLITAGVALLAVLAYRGWRTVPPKANHRSSGNNLIPTLLSSDQYRAEAKKSVSFILKALALVGPEAKYDPVKVREFLMQLPEELRSQLAMAFILEEVHALDDARLLIAFDAADEVMHPESVDSL